MENSINFKTKFGWIFVREEKKFITEIKFGKKKISGKKSHNLIKVKKKINLFFNKKINNINFKHKIEGNKLEKKIWKKIKNIKKGKVKTYGEIAKKLKISPRYVGRVCGKNNLLLFVPCHRIVRSDKNLGGFSSPGGIKLKRKLLEFEGIFI